MANVCEIIFSTSLALFGLTLEMFLVERTECNNVNNMFL